MRLCSAGLAFAFCFIAGPAASLTLKNLDPEDRRIVIKENDKKTEKVLKPQEEVADACAAACEIEIGEDAYDFDGNEYVTIEEGLLFISDATADPPKP
jgi:hypothetical protein